MMSTSNRFLRFGASRNQRARPAHRRPPNLRPHGDALEAQCFGFLSARTRRGLPISFPGTTGVPRPQTGGRMIEPAAA